MADETFSVLKTVRISQSDQARLNRFKKTRKISGDSTAIRTMIREAVPA